MKCRDCGKNRAYQRKTVTIGGRHVAWRLCRVCWGELLAILQWASGKENRDGKTVA